MIMSVFGYDGKAFPLEDYEKCYLLINSFNYDPAFAEFEEDRVEDENRIKKAILLNASYMLLRGFHKGVQEEMKEAGEEYTIEEYSKCIDDVLFKATKEYMKQQEEKDKESIK